MFDSNLVRVSVTDVGDGSEMLKVGSHRSIRFPMPPVLRHAMLTVAVLLAVLVPPVTHQADASTAFDPNSMTFPVDGEFRMYDNFGACRDGCKRKHEGVDIMAAKMVPVLAVADGQVTWISTSQSNCCYLGLSHGNGWVTRYIHLNNDTPGTDDGKAWGIAPGIVYGSHVTRGQLIGWVGDSGNAENTAPHLHFELRKDGTAIDPYDYLLKALESWNGTFRDDDTSIHEEDIERIYARDITRGCNPPTNDRYCPNDNITRGEMAAFIVRALKLTASTGSTPFTDLAGHRFEGDVDRLMTAGIGFGCTEIEFCPNQALLRDEMAELLVRAFGFDDENPDGIDFFVDDEGNRFEDSINKIGANGVTKGCNPPDNDRFCPDRSLTRAEMASFMVRALAESGR
jgi:flavodoxin